MIKKLTRLLGNIVGRINKIMLTNWFLTLGAMALPVGFTLITLSAINKDSPIALYWLGWALGAIGLYSFSRALFKAYYEDIERQKLLKKNDENFRSIMKTMEAIRGQLESIGKKLDRKR